VNAPPRGAGTRGHRVATTTPQNGRLCCRSVRAPTKGGPVARARSRSGSGQQGLGAPSLGQWPTGSARTGRHARGPAGTAVANHTTRRAHQADVLCEGAGGLVPASIGGRREGHSLDDSSSEQRALDPVNVPGATGAAETRFPLPFGAQENHRLRVFGMGLQP